MTRMQAIKTLFDLMVTSDELTRYREAMGVLSHDEVSEVIAEKARLEKEAEDEE